MAKIVKPDLTYQWASAAGGGSVAPSSGKIQTGHIVEKPNYEYMNWLQNRQDTSIAYTFQMGVVEWDSLVEYQYHANYKSYVQRNGLIYKALQVGTNKDPATEAAYWALAFDNYGSAATVQTNLNTHITNYGTLASLSNVATARSNLDVYSTGQVDSALALKALLAGSSSQLFSAANGTAGYEVVNFSQLAAKAPVAGNAAQEFAVANATVGNSAVNLTTLINIVYPVGSVYISKTDNRNPYVILGVGAWAAVDGKALFGYKSGDADFGTVGSGGGSKDLSLTLTVDSRISATLSPPPGTVTATTNGTYSSYINTGDGAVATDVDCRFKLSQEKILPPYDTFYIWERTA